MKSPDDKWEKMFDHKGYTWAFNLISISGYLASCWHPRNEICQTWFFYNFLSSITHYNAFWFLMLASCLLTTIFTSVAFSAKVLSKRVLLGSYLGVWVLLGSLGMDKYFHWAMASGNSGLPKLPQAYILHYCPNNQSIFVYHVIQNL